MHHQLPSPSTCQQVSVLQSRDLVAGLGAAPRHLLATCLALFEDGTLQQRLSERIDALGKRWASRGHRGQEEGDAAAMPSPVASLQQGVIDWQQAPVPDDDLRLLLWMRLREAFGLDASTFGSLRSAGTAADDLVATLLASLQPGLLDKAKAGLGLDTRTAPDSLDALARQTLDEMLAQVMQGDDAAHATARQALVADVRQRVSQLDPAVRAQLLEAIGARELNDDAIRTILLTGGGLASLGTAVSVAGFSAYILAAQASAFIPLVSGPALVSFVAVLSNPVTIVLATLGTGWWAARSANQKIQAAIAMRVIALLALNGLTAGNAGLRGMAQAFGRVSELDRLGTLPRNVHERYRGDWALICPAHRDPVALRPEVARMMERGLPGQPEVDGWARVMCEGDGAHSDMAAMSALTLGELLYHLHVLNPQVLQAADFSRIPDLSDPLEFAAFAHAVASLGAEAQLGAISNLKGYVAEQVVASQLVQQGHIVEFPATANEPGWDLMVDGIKFQVKNAADLSLLEQHFERYDYPVLANAEVAEMLAQAEEKGQLPEWASQVHFVEGYSQEGVQHVTEHTLDAGDALLHPHVPAFAVVLSALREWQRYSAGQTTASLALQEVMINGSIRAGLAVAGNFAGVTIGLLVFGPAGGLVLGSVLPILSRTQSERAKALANKVVRGKGYMVWQEQACQTHRTLVERLESGLKDKAERLKSRTATGPDLAKDYVAWRLNDELRFLREAWLRLQTISQGAESDIEAAAEKLLLWIGTCTLHPAVYQVELMQWLRVMELRPTLGQNLAEKGQSGLTGLRDFFAGVKEGWEEGRSKFRP